MSITQRHPTARRGIRRVRANANLLAALSLSIILLASTVPLSYAADEWTTILFKRFDGNDYLNVPSSSNLQLSQFAVEARFRISQYPDTLQYIVSKGAGGIENRIFDQNYALFLTKEGIVGGGFQARDGTHHFVYSDRVIVDAGWKTIRLAYDGIRLNLKFEGITDVYKSVNKPPDDSGTGSLRIGANSNSLDGFLVGDIDYVKIIDRTTFNKVYANYFSDTSGGTVSDPGPIPEPAPSPSPSPDLSGDCSDIPMRQLKGAVFMDPVLGTWENGGSTNAPWNYVSESMKYMKANGMNFVRVPYYWEAYVHDPTAFLNELEAVAKAADANNICVVFANFHWYTTSYWNIEIIGNSDGRGFPSFVVKNFQTKYNNYDATAGPFWNAFLSNSIVINGKNVWDVQADFFAKVINRVDRYGSVTGYEILNEPHLFDESQYAKLGNYHTYMAQKMRSITDKKIFFDREVPRTMERQPSMEYKIVPRGVTGLVYEPHLYSLPSPGSQGENQLDNFYQWSREWGVEVMVGEWGADTQTETDIYVKAMKEKGFGWTYYAWKAATDRGEGNALYDSSTTDPTLALRQLSSSIARIY